MLLHEISIGETCNINSINSNIISYDQYLLSQSHNDYIPIQNSPWFLDDVNWNEDSWMSLHTNMNTLSF